ncbi:MAG: GNAT family N-acetyltransferase [Spirochaetales bacterium]|nr:GNAT family N-acetyltransferase [Spirochaetales bacterium]
MIEIIEIDVKDLHLVKPLWEELNSMHMKKSIYFSNDFNNFSFEQRKQKLINKSKLLILVCKKKDNNEIVGYCISSINDSEGEVDSIFIKSSFRKNHLGSELMNKTMEWFDHENVGNIEILVAHGNEEVLPFYEKFGFFPRACKLKRRKK